MLSNLATSILDKERVVTTVAKAKEVRGVVERLITYGKKGSDNLGAIRRAARTIRDKTVLKKLFDDIAVSYKEREGGYTRIVKLGERKGDNAEMSIIELVGRNGDEPRRRDKKRRRPAAKKPAKAKAAAPQQAAAPKTDEAEPKKSVKDESAAATQAEAGVAPARKAEAAEEAPKGEAAEGEDKAKPGPEAEKKE